MPTTLPILSLLESRVLGVLAEKQRTVPDSYPLTLNSLVSGCNQKSSRDPIIEASESEVQVALDSLRGISLIVETSGGRVLRYGHNIEKVLHIPSQSTALLAMLILRGPLTAGELRINCERLHKFADISSVESFLVELAERAESGRWWSCLASPVHTKIVGPICCVALLPKMSAGPGHWHLQCPMAM